MCVLGDSRMLCLAHILTRAIYFYASVVKLGLQPDSHKEIFIVNSQMGPRLRDVQTSEESLRKWFLYCDVHQTTTLVFPYASEYGFSNLGHVFY